MAVKHIYIVGILAIFSHFTESYIQAIKESQKTICNYSVLVQTHLNSNCTGAVTVKIFLPPGFWEAMKKLNYKSAIFEVQNTTGRDHYWTITCFQTGEMFCERELQMIHPLTGKLELKVIFQYFCTYVQPPATRCFREQQTTQTPRYILATNGFSLGYKQYMVVFVISITAFGAMLLGIVIACLRHRRQLQQSYPWPGILYPWVINFAIYVEIFLLNAVIYPVFLLDGREWRRTFLKNGLKVAYLEISDTTSRLCPESNPLCDKELFWRENFKAQVKYHCMATIINSEKAMDFHINMSDMVQDMIQSNDAFIIVPSVRMTPIQEDLADPDVQVAIEILRLLNNRASCCVFVRFSENDTTHQVIRNRYRHFLRIPMYTFHGTTKNNCIQTDKITRMLKYLQTKSSSSSSTNFTSVAPESI